MSDNTRKNLDFAFAAESKASARNLAFALKAEQEGYAQLARLFRAVADAQSVHAYRYLLSMRGKIGSTQENLDRSYWNEFRASTEDYPRFLRDAEKDGNRPVRKAFSHARDVNAQHAELFREATKDMLLGSEAEFYVCQICGHISLDSIPENCPVCHAVRGRCKRMT
jgi:rubrerythrin